MAKPATAWAFLQSNGIRSPLEKTRQRSRQNQVAMASAAQSQSKLSGAMLRIETCGLTPYSGRALILQATYAQVC